MTAEIQADLTKCANVAVETIAQRLGPVLQPIDREFVKLGGLCSVQRCIDCELERCENLSTEDFIRLIILPASLNLTMTCRDLVQFGVLEVPPDCQGSVVESGRVSIRLIVGTRLNPVFDATGRLVGHDEPSLVLRIDALGRTGE
jgi:hypothetical protein